METPRYSGLVPMLPVSDVPATIAFYELIGFKVGNSVTAEGATRPNWAWLYNGDAHVMINQSPEPIQQRTPVHVHDPDGHAVFIAHAD